MAEEIGFENGRNSNFQGLVTLTLDPAIRHTVVHHSSTSTSLPTYEISLKSKKLFVDGRTYGHFPPSNIIRSTFGSRPKKEKSQTNMNLNCRFAFFRSRSKERKFQGAKVPGCESSKERKFQGAKVPHLELSLTAGSEWSWERKVHNSFSKTGDLYKLLELLSSVFMLS